MFTFTSVLTRLKAFDLKTSEGRYLTSPVYCSNHSGQVQIRGVVIPSLSEDTGLSILGPPHCCLIWKEASYSCCIILHNFPKNFLISFTFSILNTVDLDLYSYLRLTERIASLLLESIWECVFYWLYQHIRSSTKTYPAVATRFLLKWTFIRSQALTSQTSTSCFRRHFLNKKSV